MWDSRFFPLLITSSSKHRKHQFLIHSMLFFQHLLGMKNKTMTICIWFHFLSLCDDAEILVSDCLDPAFLCLCLRFFFFFYCSSCFKGTKLLFTHCVHRTHNHFIQKKLLKMGPTTLFTYLKIILIQYFQFSVFNKISCIQKDP